MKRATLQEIKKSRFRQQPKILDESEYYKNLSIGARYLYGIMLDKFKLSHKNNWVNDNGEVYFIFKQKELAKLMNVSVRSVNNYTKELINYELIEKENTMTVNLYYITLEFQQVENFACRSGNICSTNRNNLQNNSDTDSSDTKNSDTDFLHSNGKNVTTVDDKYIYFKNLWHDDTVYIANKLLDTKREKMSFTNYKLAVEVLGEVLESDRLFTIDELIETYSDVYKPNKPSVEHFVRCMPGIYEKLNYNGNSVKNIIDKYD